MKANPLVRVSLSFVLLLILLALGILGNTIWFTLAILLPETPEFVGRRDVAILDLWSLQHMAVGLLIGFLFPRPRLDQSKGEMDFALWVLKFYLYGVLICAAALGWELWELGAEAGHFGTQTASWFSNNHEHAANRLWTDPALVYTGAIIAPWFPSLKRWVIGFVLLWVVVNLLMPSSVTIQNYILG